MLTSSSHVPAIAIFCDNLKLGIAPFTSEYYWEAYQELMFALKDRGVEVYFVAGNDSYVGDGLFETAYTLGIKTPNPKNLKAVSRVHVDLVYDRAYDTEGFLGDDVLVMNPTSIRNLGRSKIEMYRMFGPLQPMSMEAVDRSGLEAAITAMPGDKVVVKVPDGSGGHGVFIGAKDVVLANAPQDKFPLLVQEFVDTSAGAPGAGPGVHDVRTGVCGGKVISYYIRQAQPGRLHSNVSQGGEMKFLSPDDLPQDLAAKIRQVDEPFAGSPRYYSIDFVHTDRGWQMMEINPCIALLPVSDGEEAASTQRQLADYIAAKCLPAAHTPLAKRQA